MNAARGSAQARPVEDQIADELGAVAQRLVGGVFTPGDERSVPALSALAQRHFSDRWPEAVGPEDERAVEVAQAKSAVLADMLRIAADRLEKHFGNITAEEAALRLFNLDGGGTSRPDITPVVVYGISGRRFSEVRDDLLARAGFTEKRHRPSDKIRALRQSLARVLTDPAFPFKPVDNIRTATALAVRSTLEDKYVPRSEYEELIRRHRDSGSTCIWLWGDAGTGKTRLARAVNRDRLVERAVPVLTPADQKSFDDQMAQLVLQSGVNGGEINAVTVKGLFIAQLGKGKLPKALVFDEMPDDGLADTLGSVAHGSFLIFTSIRRPARFKGSTLELRSMAIAESEQMVRSRLPGAQDSDVERLVAMLAGRPLAIEHSCSFLRSTGMSVPEYCLALTDQPARILDLAGNPTGRTLTKVYELTLSGLAGSPDTLRALDYILFTEPGVLTVDMLAFLWADSVTIRSPEMAQAALRSMNSHVRSTLDAHHWPGVELQKPAQIAYVDPASTAILRGALLELADFGIIRSERDQIVVHQLTRTILRELRRDQATNVYERIRSTVDELLSIDQWEPGEPLMADMLPWAPHVVRAVSPFDVEAANAVESMSVNEVKRVARLGAMLVRAYWQTGISINVAMNSVKHLYAIVATRTLWTGYNDEERKQLFSRFFGFYNEMMTVAIIDAGFSRKMDGAFTLTEVSAEQRRQASGIRLRYDTEWELSHSLVRFEDSDKPYRAPALDGFDLERTKGSADNAMLRSRAYYDQCRWRDTIAALEHAFTCYIRIGGDLGAVRGAIDAARRLARTHLRAGPAAVESAATRMAHLDQADKWLDEGLEVMRRRSLALVNDKPSRFLLYDKLLEAQFVQVRTEIALTRQLMAWDDDPDLDEERLPETVAAFVTEPYRLANGNLSDYSRLQEAEQAFELLQRIRGLRLVPELRMHLVRLHMMAADPRAEQHIGNLRDWFARDQLNYQADLLATQVLTLSTSATALLLMPDGLDLLSQTEHLSDQAHEEIRAVRENSAAVADHYYAAAHGMRTHRNPYWHARGLAAALIIGMVSGRERTWIDGVRAELERAATAIGRTDWVERANAYGEANGGLWLLGY
ncbi:hypothetical protein [Micromonospora sp. CPCC 205558]|uniref:hypothetical protein n=1 Tax=Micromonospora sp. CPCC 205558 TaxID=3122403 RepID=UPI002FF0FD67